MLFDEMLVYDATLVYQMAQRKAGSGKISAKFELKPPPYPLVRFAC